MTGVYKTPSFIVALISKVWTFNYPTFNLRREYEIINFMWFLIITKCKMDYCNAFSNVMALNLWSFKMILFVLLFRFECRKLIVLFWIDSKFYIDYLPTTHKLKLFCAIFVTSQYFKELQSPILGWRILMFWYHYSDKMHKWNSLVIFW